MRISTRAEQQNVTSVAILVVLVVGCVPRVLGFYSAFLFLFRLHYSYFILALIQKRLGLKGAPFLFFYIYDNSTSLFS